ncbi:MAG TPA: CBS domain-containing protein [Spirochaetia bacterium]|nr:CBS domain-containing protein [Spirochaetia bacterium]
MIPLPLNTEESPAYILELIYRLKIRNVMTTRLIVAARDDTLRHVQKLMKENAITGVPVAEGPRLVGLLSMDDIIRALDGGYIDDLAGKWMTRNLIVLEDDMPLSFGISYMEKYRFGRFPVLSKNKELVGIVTSRDIIVALLLEINNEMERIEREVLPRPETAGGRTRRVYSTRRFDFENAGRASSEIKRLLKEQGVAAPIVRRVSVAAYELEMNQVVHSVGGRITFTSDADTAEIVAVDMGPGIENVEAAMEEGFSTATEWIRSLGFGAGMGLTNVKRVSDEFSLESRIGAGTTARSLVRLRPSVGEQPSKKDTGD